MALKLKDSVVVKSGVKDPDLDISIEGWQGRISDINEELVCIDWDSVTLKNMEASIITRCEQDGLDWTKIYLLADEVTLTKPRDRMKDVKKVIDELNKNYARVSLGEEGVRIQKLLSKRESIMIDDAEKTQELLSKLTEQLPITAYPGKELMKMMQSSGELADEKKQLEIEQVMYGGDEGGILCALKAWENSKQAYVVSITHLKIPREHPLGREIRAYQKQRTLRLSLLEGKGKGKRGVKKSKNKGFSKWQR